MINFFKKDKEERERKKKEKKDRKEKEKQNPLTHEELERLDEAKKGLFGRRWSFGEKDKHKQRKGSDGMMQSDSESSLASLSSRASSSKDVEISTPVYDTPPPPAHTTSVEIQLNNNQPKKSESHNKRLSSKPKKGILKGKSSYGPAIPNQGVVGNVDDVENLQMITLVNEVLSGDRVDSKDMKLGQKLSSKERDAVIRLGQEAKFLIEKPAHEMVTGKTFNCELKLPAVEQVRTLRARDMVLSRQPAGDFGFSLRRGTMLDRCAANALERKRMVVFAEPGSGPKCVQTELLPGDRLIEINGINVENNTREEIIELIKRSGDDVRLKVQPIPELCELSMRSLGVGGGHVLLDDENVKTGSLRRSGSIKYKKKEAKTDDQLAHEKDWLEVERIWLAHKDGYTAAHLLKSADEDATLPEGKAKVKLASSGEIIEVDEDAVEKCNPPQFDRTEDLAALRYLNESSMLHTIRQRYGNNLIHTYAGPSMLIVNPMHPMSIYSEKVIQMFRGCKHEDMPPHIYAAAQSAYKIMLATKHDQSLIFLGRSGSGKTTNLRHAINYLMVTTNSPHSLVTLDKIHAVFILLEAFGHTRTIQNSNASRFMQLFSIDFDHSGQIASASIQISLLEKTRLIRRPEGEPTFHVFYQMLAGLDSQMKNELHLASLNEPNAFMTPLLRKLKVQTPEEKQKAAQAWAKIQHALNTIESTDEEARAIFAVLAGIYHLGVAGANMGANNKPQFANPNGAQKAAFVLGLDVEELGRNVFTPNLTPGTVRGPRRAPNSLSPNASKDQSSQDLDMTPIEYLEGFVVGLYQEMFNALLNIINRSLASNVRIVNSITIADGPGFQNPVSCGRESGATFEDLCYNYCQERLQLLFHENIFTQQQDRYVQENVECDYDSTFPTPAPMVEFLDKPSQSSLVSTESPVHKQIDMVRTSGLDRRDTDQKGLLWILDEEAILPGANEETFIRRVYNGYRDRRDGWHLLYPEEDLSFFTLNHCQGNNPVTYNTSGWLKAARENPVVKTALAVLQESQRENIAHLFSTIRTMPTTFSGSMVGMEGGATGLRRSTSMRRSYVGGAGLKRRSIPIQLKTQMDSTGEQLRRTNMHFVHCVLPQPNAGTCDIKGSTSALGTLPTMEDFMINVGLLRQQIRGSEILETVRIHRQGYPEHMLYPDFRKRYEVLSPIPLKNGAVTDDKQAVEQLLDFLEIENNTYRLGLSQIFFRSGGLAQLEDAREEKLSGTIQRFQAYCRGYLARQYLSKLKLQHLAVSCIQRNVRKFMAIRTWTWWRLYTKVQPLLDVHRTEEELKNKDVELEQLRLKADKLERERNEYKLNSDRLESKLNELTADLMDEHTTSSQAAEILEAESSERMRLEKELRDSQAKLTAYQRKNEQLEVQVMQSQLWTSAIDGEMDDDEDEGDSLYKQKYDNLRREMEFMKKQLQHQHEEDLEQERNSKKHLERRLNELTEENEEQRRQLLNAKRKTQKCTTDMQDIKFHLEEQISRNSDLEKKQRRFDAELAHYQSEAEEEKIQREKIHREREQLSAEKYTVSTELSQLQEEHDAQSAVIRKLQDELSDLTEAGNKGDEALVLKRQIRELEAKVQDQEEELDEQAGTIQQLEQAKLRLEMDQEKKRQQYQKDLDEKDVEVEEMRASTQRKLKQLEVQIEDEYEEKQKAVKDKRDLEHQLQELGARGPERDRGAERSLRRDLKRTKALLKDAQTMLDRQKDPTANRNIIKQLRNQLEDAEFAKAAAIKSRKGLEMEVEDLNHQLNDQSKAKQEIESKLLIASRERMELQNKIDDLDEELAELMKKYKAAVQQQSVDQITISDQLQQIGELNSELETLKEQLAQVSTRVQYLEVDHVDKQAVAILEAKHRESESKLELERTTRHRLEMQIERTKETIDNLTTQKDDLVSKDERQQEINRRLQRQLRDAQEELGEIRGKEAETNQRKHDLEVKAESLEADYDHAQTDLKLAFRRIADLQAALEEDMDSDLEGSDSDLGEYTDEEDETDEEDDDDDDDDNITNHRASLSSLTKSSMDSSLQMDDASVS
ncbi:unconventional myosin-XVIIIa-like isoform X2 [Tubulanus polymorphus]|uniref:unconventional myosin-XVIIIa-like isoform X2 n=1 Tax=Tubulanus polymorphus TaxID=672921 RepID=UPI003DA541C5